MKKSVLTIAAVLLFLGSAIADNDSNEASHNVSITIPTVSLVDVEGASGNTIELEPSIAALEAGDAVSFAAATDNSLWLNYTSVVTGNGNQSSRDITVSITETLPEGLSLQLLVGEVTTGKGKKGEAVNGIITLSGTSQTIVSKIGSCHTGSGVSKGHNLTYSLAMDNNEYSTLLADDYSVTVTYTITE